jgi:nitrile hydratase
MAPASYLGVTYYEKWLDGITRLLAEKGVVTAEELERRQAFFRERPDAPARAAVEGTPPPPPPVDRSWQSFIRDSKAPPRFSAGDAVVTRHHHPHGHTRLPRYARGKRGVIARFHGVQVFPDAHAHGLGERPQPLYSVRFDAVELWGESAEPNATVHVDLWESYLEPAGGVARG